MSPRCQALDGSYIGRAPAPRRDVAWREIVRLSEADGGLQRIRTALSWAETAPEVPQGDEADETKGVWHRQ